MQTDGNFVVYDGNGVAQWASATGAIRRLLSVNDDGNLVIYGSDSQPIWTHLAGSLP